MARIPGSTSLSDFAVAQKWMEEQNADMFAPPPPPPISEKKRGKMRAGDPVLKQDSAAVPSSSSQPQKSLLPENMRNKASDSAKAKWLKRMVDSLPKGDIAPKSASTDIPQERQSQSTDDGPTEEEMEEMRADAHIAALRQLSSQVKNRIKPAFSFYLAKPSSKQLEYIKGMQGAAGRTAAEERTTLSKRLEKFLKKELPLPEGVTVDQVLEMWLSVQHAKLRTHDRKARSDYKKDQFATILTNTLMSSVLALGTFGGTLAGLPLSIKLGRQDTNKTRKEYYRSANPDNRPEYAEAFNGFMEMLGTSDEVIPHAQKLRIAQVLLDQHIRKEETIYTGDHNALVRALPGGEHNPVRGHTTCRIPRRSDGEEAANLKAIIAFARTGYRHDREAMRNRARRQVGAMLRAGQNIPPLDDSMRMAYQRINELRKDNKEPEIQMPHDLTIYNDIPNASAFSSLLKKFNKEVKVNNKEARAKARKDYANVEIIFASLGSTKKTLDRTHAKRVFHRSAGGDQDCINNRKEFMQELATMSLNRQTIKKIESGEMGSEELFNAVLENFHLDHVNQYITDEAIPELVKHEPNINSAYEPEVGQIIKWTLKSKKGLALPDTVKPDHAARQWELMRQQYKGTKKKQTLVEYIESEVSDKANDHVVALEKDGKSLKAYLAADPLWREGIAALARKMGKHPQDVAQLDNYTTNRDKFVFKEDEGDEGALYRAEHDPIMMEFAPVGEPLPKDPNLSKAVWADGLLLKGDEVYRPEGNEVIEREEVQVRKRVNLHDLRRAQGMEAGQFAEDEEYETQVREKRVFKTDVKESQKLADTLAKMDRSHEEALRDIERQYARHAIDSMLESRQLPEDGTFKPSFTLPDDLWGPENIADVKAMSQKARIADTKELYKKQWQEIKQLQEEMGKMIKGVVGSANEGNRQLLGQIRDYLSQNLERVEDILQRKENIERLEYQFGLSRDPKMKEDIEKEVREIRELENKIISLKDYQIEIRNMNEAQIKKYTEQDTQLARQIKQLEEEINGLRKEQKEQKEQEAENASDPERQRAISEMIGEKEEELEQARKERSSLEKLTFDAVDVKTKKLVSLFCHLYAYEGQPEEIRKNDNGNPIYGPTTSFPQPFDEGTATLCPTMPQPFDEGTATLCPTMLGKLAAKFFVLSQKESGIAMTGNLLMLEGVDIGNLNIEEDDDEIESDGNPREAMASPS